MLLAGGNSSTGPNWVVDETSPPGYSRIYRIYGGVVNYRDDYEKKRLTRGAVYVMPSAAPYHMGTDPVNPLCCTFIHLDFRPVITRRLICLDADSVYGAIFGAFRRIYSTKKDGAALPHLADAFVAEGLESGALDRPSPFIEAVHAFVASNFHKPLTISRLSAQFGYNEQYFIRRFKAAAGLPPYQYLLEFRLREAIRLLSGDCSVEAIAEAVGFKDSKTFCRAFSHRYGMPPGRFRRLTTVAP